MYLNENKTCSCKKAYNPCKHFPKYSTFSNSSLETYKQNYSDVALKQQGCNKPPVKKAFYQLCS